MHEGIKPGGWKSVVNKDDTKVDKYEFGKNWLRFLEHYDSEKLEISRAHLLKRLRLDSLDGKTFLDIGCGSGLHSLAALSAGAEKVYSIDVDKDSVEATRQLWEKMGRPENWSIQNGDVLDKSFLETLGKFDIVYSWGVLHHTGEMWKAVANATIPMDDNGVFYIALYASEMYQNPSPEFWIDIKRRYNKGSDKEKKELENWYAWERALKNRALKGENPFDIMDAYKESRGMDFWTDIRDWLGGYPIEFSLTRDVVRFLDEQGLAVLDVISGEGNTEFIFKHKNSTSYWDTFESEVMQLEGPFEHVEGHCYTVQVDDIQIEGDSRENPYVSPLLLCEDGLVVGFPHAYQTAIKEKGEGRFSHWGKTLLFSASDNSDPNSNGHQYSIFYFKNDV